MVCLPVISVVNTTVRSCFNQCWLIIPYLCQPVSQRLLVADFLKPAPGRSLPETIGTAF
jgi:hypothetical protein